MWQKRIRFKHVECFFADIQNFASIGKEEVYFLTWKSYGQTLIKRALVLLGLVFKKL